MEASGEQYAGTMKGGVWGLLGVLQQMGFRGWDEQEDACFAGRDLGLGLGLCLGLGLGRAEGGGPREPCRKKEGLAGSGV